MKGFWDALKCRLAARAHERRANALYRRGRVEEAIAEYREAVRLRPDSALTHHNLGLALYKAGRKSEAHQEWRAVLALAGEKSPYLAEQARILLRQFG